MNRAEMLERALGRRGAWDMVVVGGGAAGVGVALDAAARGYEVLLLEEGDFGRGTSGRSTKLVHGGVRYLKQGDLRLVREALKERALLRRNAPHVVRDLAFVLPTYARRESAFYGAGLKLYDLLAGADNIRASRLLSRAEALALQPAIRDEGLRGGVLYYDGQFDDARLLIDLAATASGLGAVLLNYARVTGFAGGGGGRLSAARVRDLETGEEFTAGAKVIVNATGAFCDAVRGMAEPGAPPLVTLSRGIHLVLDKSFLPGRAALLVPRTRDGRVMFAIPWLGRAIVGTTDTPVAGPVPEPTAGEEEVAEVLGTAGRYLRTAPAREDVLSVFAGLRPLVRPARADRNTAALSRGHTLHLDRSGLLTVTGGKWTTYRLMAEDCVSRAADLAGLPARPCVTKSLRVHGFHERPDEFGALAVYGADAPSVRALIDSDPRLGERLHPSLPYCGAEAVWAARREMARTVEDVLARRTRSLLLDARAAADAAPRVAELLAAELGRDGKWAEAQVESFRRLASGHFSLGVRPLVPAGRRDARIVPGT